MRVREYVCMYACARMNITFPITSTLPASAFPHTPPLLVPLLSTHALPLFPAPTPTHRGVDGVEGDVEPMAAVRQWLLWWVVLMMMVMADG